MTSWNSQLDPSGVFRHDSNFVAQNWARLHAGDAEPLPADIDVLNAWTLFHNGHYEAAADAGASLGDAGMTVANKATCMYASLVETRESTRLMLLNSVAERAQAQTGRDPTNPNAWYWRAYALGRYSQGISVAKALAQGLGHAVKEAIEQTIKLQPNHADAHITMGAFHSEIIDKVGPMIGNMTYGARKDVGLKMFEEGVRLNPHSAIALVEQANGLLMLEGNKKMKEATALYKKAASLKPMDATEWLNVHLARAELEDR